VIFVGIDPGLTGGIAVIDEKTTPIYVGAFKAVAGEFSAHAFADMLNAIRQVNPVMILSNTRIVVGVEKVHSMPGQGVSSSFKFGNTYGKIQGVLAAKHIPFELITPQAWTRVMLAGEPKDDKKNRGKNVAQRLWPELSLRENERCRTVHSGMADALLIAEYLRRKHLGITSQP
jgi:Holliday junction resolvasome RuvABC endonuclease subunit